MRCLPYPDTGESLLLVNFAWQGRRKRNVRNAQKYEAIGFVGYGSPPAGRQVPGTRLN